jgi:hypothetical protein
MLNFFNCTENKNKDNPLNLLRKKLKVVNTFQDYSYILKKLNEFDILKNVLLNDKQLLCFDYLAKPYSSETDPCLSRSFSALFNSEMINKENLVNYYVEILTDEPLEGINEKLFQYLSDDVKKEILMKLNKNI